MSEKSLSETQPVSFGERLAGSQAFSDLFRDGMALVEETATYLDGPGRQHRELIERSQKLYAKVRRLDANIYNQNAGERPETANPVERQLGLLKAAFEAESA